MLSIVAGLPSEGGGGAIIPRLPYQHNLHTLVAHTLGTYVFEDLGSRPLAMTSFHVGVYSWGVGFRWFWLIVPLDETIFTVPTSYWSPASVKS